jgi:isoleucyl-tRNA synthetase
MHVISQIIFGKAPFENVVTTGTILAGDGSKMSKSKNNFPDPWLVIGKYGVDSLRFYLMNSVVMQADNLNFSEKDLETVHRKVTMILWNVHQYYMTYAPQAAGSEAGSSGAPESGHVLDRWITARAKELVAVVTDNLDGYDTVHATRAIADFVDDLSTWYLRRSRGREDASFFETFRATLLTAAQATSPFMPHVAEAIYRDLRREGEPESVHLTEWPAKKKLSSEEKKLLEDMAVVREAASIGSAVRKTANIPVRQPLARIYVVDKEGKPVRLAPELTEILLSELNVKSMEGLSAGAGIAASAEDVPGRFAVYLDTNLTKELELEGEVRRLERAIQEKRKEMGLKVGEMARLTYYVTDSETEEAFRGIDTKKTYIAEMEKGEAPAEGFKLEKL